MMCTLSLHNSIFEASLLKWLFGAFLFKQQSVDYILNGLFDMLIFLYSEYDILIKPLKVFP